MGPTPRPETGRLRGSCRAIVSLRARGCRSDREAPLKDQGRSRAGSSGMAGRHACRYCRQPTDPEARSCAHCGAATDVRAVVSRSGWQAQPPIRDMARIQFGSSYCQIEGVQVPIADFNLAGPEQIYFSHHHLLWCDPTVQLSPRSMAGGWSRLYAGVPLVMLQAGGPGHVALSDDHPGETIAVPLDEHREVVVAEHRFLAATANVEYTWQASTLWYLTQKRDDREQHYPLGRYLDRFGASGGPGLLLLHAPGNTFVRELDPTGSVRARPSSLVYADSSVRMSLHFEFPAGARDLYLQPGVSHMLHYVWLELRGPGRVALQSVFERPEATGPPVNIQDCGHTASAW